MRFQQTLSRVALLYPYALPETFVEEFEKVYVFHQLTDISLLPVNCLVSTSFHDRLLFVCITPLVFILLVVGVYAFQRFRISQKWADDDPAKVGHALGKLQSKCVYVVVLVLFTVFPLISTTIFQTFKYDDRLGIDLAYLEADYTIERSDPTHQGYVQFAIVMGILYCVGIPASSFALMWCKLRPIQKMQGLQAKAVLLEERLAAIKLEERDVVPKARMRGPSVLSSPPPTVPEQTGTAVVGHIEDADSIQEELDLLLSEVDGLEEKEPLLAGLSPLYVVCVGGALFHVFCDWPLGGFIFWLTLFFHVFCFIFSVIDPVFVALFSLSLFPNPDSKPDTRIILLHIGTLSCCNFPPR